MMGVGEGVAESSLIRINTSDDNGQAVHSPAFRARGVQFELLLDCSRQIFC